MTHDNDHAALRREIEQRDQVIARLRARAVAAGYQCHVVFSTNGSGSAFLLTRWGRTHECATPEQVAAFLDRAGAKS